MYSLVRYIKCRSVTQSSRCAVTMWFFNRKNKNVSQCMPRKILEN